MSPIPKGEGRDVTWSRTPLPLLMISYPPRELSHGKGKRGFGMQIPSPYKEIISSPRQQDISGQLSATH